MFHLYKGLCICVNISYLYWVCGICSMIVFALFFSSFSFRLCVCAFPFVMWKIGLSSSFLGIGFCLIVYVVCNCFSFCYLYLVHFVFHLLLYIFLMVILQRILSRTTCKSTARSTFISLTGLKWKTWSSFVFHLLATLTFLSEDKVFDCKFPIDWLSLYWSDKWNTQIRDFKCTNKMWQQNNEKITK